MKALIAEDDELTRAALAEILEGEGYDVSAAADGKAALALFRSATPDFVCLDIMMPGLDGYRLCREIRALDAAVPIIFLSAKAEEVDKVLGLDLGADDFLAKPFGAQEVAARVRAVARRALARKPKETARAPFRLGDLDVFPEELRARRGETPIDLGPRDVALLELFYLNPGRVLDRAFLFDRAWGLGHLPNSRTLDQHISQLRKKIERDPRAPILIETVHGVGYRYNEPA